MSFNTFFSVLKNFKTKYLFHFAISPFRYFAISLIIISRLKVEAGLYCAQCDDRFGRRTKRLKVEAGLNAARFTRTLLLRKNKIKYIFVYIHTFFNKNSFYKNHEAQISKNLRIF